MGRQTDTPANPGEVTEQADSDRQKCPLALGENPVRLIKGAAGCRAWERKGSRGAWLERELGELAGRRDSEGSVYLWQEPQTCTAVGFGVGILVGKLLVCHLRLIDPIPEASKAPRFSKNGLCFPSVSAL